MERTRRVEKRAQERVYSNEGTMEGQCGGRWTRKDGKVEKGEERMKEKKARVKWRENESVGEAVSGINEVFDPKCEMALDFRASGSKMHLRSRSGAQGETAGIPCHR